MPCHFSREREWVVSVHEWSQPVMQYKLIPLISLSCPNANLSLFLQGFLFCFDLFVWFFFFKKSFPLALLFSEFPTCSSVKKCIPKTDRNSLLSIKKPLCFQSCFSVFSTLQFSTSEHTSFFVHSITLFYWCSGQQIREGTLHSNSSIISHPGATFYKVWLPSNCISSKNNLNGHFLEQVILKYISINAE